MGGPAFVLQGKHIAGLLYAVDGADSWWPCVLGGQHTALLLYCVSDTGSN